MKRMIITLTFILALMPSASPALDLDLVGGAAIAYNAIGPDHDAGNRWNLYYYGGARIWTIGPPRNGNTVWGIVHHLGVNKSDVAGWGGKLAVSSRVRGTDFYLLGGLGFVDAIAQESDGDLTAGMFADFGTLWDASDLVDVAAGIQAVDRGAEFGLSVHASFVITDPSALGDAALEVVRRPLRCIPGFKD